MREEAALALSQQIRIRLMYIYIIQIYIQMYVHESCLLFHIQELHYVYYKCKAEDQFVLCVYTYVQIFTHYYI